MRYFYQFFPYKMLCYVHETEQVSALVLNRKTTEDSYRQRMVICSIQVRKSVDWTQVDIDRYAGTVHMI